MPSCYEERKMLTRGRKPIEGEKITARLQLWVTPSFRRQMEREAIDAGYTSVSNYVREQKLGCRVPTAPIHDPRAIA